MRREPSILPTLALLIALLLAVECWLIEVDRAANLAAQVESLRKQAEADAHHSPPMIGAGP